MKLLCLDNGFGFANEIGGGSVRFAEVGKRLSLLGAELHVITTSTGREMLEDLGLITEYIELKPLPGLKKMEVFPFGRVVSYIYEIIIASPLMFKLPIFDVVYSTSDFLCDTIPAFLYSKRNKKIKWVTFVHHLVEVPWKRKGNLIINFLSFMSQRISFRLIKGRADIIFLLESPAGYNIKEHLLKIGIPTESITFTKNGIDTKTLEPLGLKEKTIDACCSVGHYARVASDIITIWKSVCEKRNSAKLVITRCNKNAETILNEYINANNLSDNIELVGIVPRKKYLEILGSSKMYISPKYEEGWGIAVFEALASSLPVVAYDLPAYNNIDAGVKKVPLGDVKSFSNAILYFLENQEARIKEGRSAKEFAREFDWDSIAKGEYGFLKKILRGRLLNETT